MSQPFAQQFKTRLALLVFIKGAAAPMVLYFEDVKAEYDEFLAAMQLPVGKLIEKEPIGPIKKVAVMSNQIASLAIQEELCQQ
ncbi:TPA: hypothetical protein IAD52_06975 [Candidatus Spyradomonas excrementavium]|nr:hypothetical protein [Candidatus Spyradomonas excrementavium]